MRLKVSWGEGSDSAQSLPGEEDSLISDAVEEKLLLCWRCSLLLYLYSWLINNDKGKQGKQNFRFQ